MDTELFMFAAVVTAVLVAVAALCAIGYLLLCERAEDYNQPRTRPASVMVILGSGGHTAEMLTLVQQLGDNYSPRYYVLASNDKISEGKVQSLENDRAQGERVIDSTKDSPVRSRHVNNSAQKGSDKCNDDLQEKTATLNTYSISKIPRSREVKQSWISTVFTTIYATLYSFPLVLKLGPDVILCNGPGTCIPLCLAGLILKIFRPTKIVYVESVCRVETLSLSGKILYYFADEMFVQWKSLQEKYPKTRYLGRLV